MSVLAKDLMWHSPPMIPPTMTLKDAAAKMAEEDSGVLPVGVEGRVEGIITDRDIVVRAIAKGRDPEKEKVSDFMTTLLYTCNEDDAIETAAAVMQESGITRLVVTDPRGDLSGILSFGHIFRADIGAVRAADFITRAVDENNLAAA